MGRRLNGSWLDRIQVHAGGVVRCSCEAQLESTELRLRTDQLDLEDRAEPVEPCRLAGRGPARIDELRELGPLPVGLGAGGVVPGEDRSGTPILLANVMDVVV